MYCFLLLIKGMCNMLKDLLVFFSTLLFLVEAFLLYTVYCIGDLEKAQHGLFPTLDPPVIMALSCILQLNVLDSPLKLLSNA